MLNTGTIIDNQKVSSRLQIGEKNVKGMFLGSDNLTISFRFRCSSITKIRKYHGTALLWILFSQECAPHCTHYTQTKQIVPRLQTVGSTHSAFTEFTETTWRTCTRPGTDACMILYQRLQQQQCSLLTTAALAVRYGLQSVTDMQQSPPEIHFSNDYLTPLTRLGQLSPFTEKILA